VAEPAVVFGFSGAGASPGYASGRETAAGECNPVHPSKDHRHAFAATFFFATFSIAVFIPLTAIQLAALTGDLDSNLNPLCD
jgi:hypothetical protein